MFRRFGSRVTIVQRGRQILPREDADVALELQKALEAEGVRFVLHAQTTRVENKNGQVLLGGAVCVDPKEAAVGDHLGDRGRLDFLDSCASVRATGDHT